MIGDDVAVRVVGEQVLTDLQAVETAISNDGARIVSGDAQGVFRLWRVLAAMPETLRKALSEWRDSENEEISTSATRLLQREG